mmetsp:Transcript_4911/g.10388  ORF Transcript_4911/g.10388 Transcript_4911/m.10388 type:complete len:153 (+) Transcript_4911:306-764(+)
MPIIETSSSPSSVRISSFENGSSKPGAAQQQNPNLNKVTRNLRERKKKKSQVQKHLYHDDRNYNAYLICKRFSESRMEKDREFKSAKEESLRAALSNNDSASSTLGSLPIVNVPSDITEATSNTFHTKIRKNPISCVSQCGGFECMYPFTCT